MKTNWLCKLKYVLLTHCKVAHQDNQTDFFIPGVYEREHKYKDFLIYETLTIRCMSQVTNVFEVERWTLRKPATEELSLGISRTERWIAAYHMPTRQLVHGISHKICSFAPERKSMFFENKEYQQTARLAFD